MERSRRRHRHEPPGRTRTLHGEQLRWVGAEERLSNANVDDVVDLAGGADRVNGELRAPETIRQSR